MYVLTQKTGLQGLKQSYLLREQGSWPAPQDSPSLPGWLFILLLLIIKAKAPTRHKAASTSSALHVSSTLSALEDHGKEANKDISNAKGTADDIILPPICVMVNSDVQATSFWIFMRGYPWSIKDSRPNISRGDAIPVQGMRSGSTHTTWLGIIHIAV